jgi:hypothetical protein
MRNLAESESDLSDRGRMGLVSNNNDLLILAIAKLRR